MPQRCKMFQFNWTQEMSEYLNWHESDPRKIRFIRCLMCGDNGIQLILWWIKIGNKNWVKCLVVDYCIITVDIFWIFLPITVTRMCISPASGCSQLFIFPKDQFSLCIALRASRCINPAKSILWKRDVQFWRNEWFWDMSIVFYLRTFTRHQTRDQGHGDKKWWSNGIL